MDEETLIKKYRLGPESRIKFKNDPQQYWIKNISPDRKNVFVHINGAQTYRKLIKNIIQIDNNKLTETKMDHNKIRKIIRQSLNEGTINTFIREIDMASEVATLNAKISEAANAIQMREEKLAQAESLNESGLIDEKRVKAIKKEVEALKKYKAKNEALLEKKQAKKAEKGGEQQLVDGKPEEEETTDESLTDEMSDFSAAEGETMDDIEGEEDLMAEEEQLDEFNLNEARRMQKLAGIKILTEQK